MEHSPVAFDGPGEENVLLTHGGHESAHSTLTQALETVLREQNDLEWMPPKHHSGFTSEYGLRVDNDSSLLLNADGSVSAEHVLDALRAAATATGERITVATGREDIGSVFKADFAADGQWSLGTYNATTRNEVEGNGPMPARQVTGEFSDALETHVERVGRESRGEERLAYAQSRPDDQALGALSQVLKNRPPAGVKAGLKTSSQASGNAAGAAERLSQSQNTSAARSTGFER